MSAQEELRSLLAEWEEDARTALESTGPRAELARRDRDLAAIELRWFARIRADLEGGDALGAIRDALHLGDVRGVRKGRLNAYAEGIVSGLLGVDAKRGRKDREDKARAGKGKKDKVRRSDEECRAALAEVRNKNPALSWTDACNIAAHNLGYSDGRTLRDRIPDTKW